MKHVLYRKIIHEAEESFSHISYPELTLPRHSHDELELVLFTAGSGKQFIGDDVEDFSKGDLALIGSNIPHLHLCGTSAGRKSSCEILQFPRSLFPDNLSAQKEFRHIRALIEKSTYGIRFQDPALSILAAETMRRTDELGGIERVIALYRLLDTLGRSRKYRLFSKTARLPEPASSDPGEPADKVFTYLTARFREPVTLDAVARYAGLSPASLCRCFRQRTGKTIFRCLAEIRVEHACGLLSHSASPVSRIGYESGFNSLSHFNRQFRAVTGQNPTEYRRQISHPPKNEIK